MLRLLYWWIVEPIAVIAVVAIACRLASSFQVNRSSWLASLGLGAAIGLPLWFILPAWDTVIGEKQFNELCRAEAGLLVYRTVVLPKEKFGPTGLPIFFEPVAKTRVSGSTEDLFGPDYRYSSSDEHVWNAGPLSHAWIERRRQELSSREKGDLLAVRTDFYFQRGGPPSLADRNLEHCRLADTPTGAHSASALARAVFLPKKWPHSFGQFRGLTAKATIVFITHVVPSELEIGDILSLMGNVIGRQEDSVQY
jgi:hypothetical protein